jgi:mRNA-degrading endonuclease YafQ of YafQ-DinJ toxin-antitoxin module
MRNIFQSPGFQAELAKFIRKHPELKPNIVKALKLLRTDIRTPSLGTHKLHGALSDSYACNINYYYRLVFSFDDNLIYPESIGSHDDVY